MSRDNPPLAQVNQAPASRARPFNPGRPSCCNSCAPPLVNYGDHRTTETRRCFRSHWLRETLHGGGGGCRSPCSLSGRGHPRSGQEGSLQPRSEQTRLVGACEMKATATQTHKVQICRQLSSQIMQKGWARILNNALVQSLQLINMRVRAEMHDIANLSYIFKI